MPGADVISYPVVCQVREEESGSKVLGWSLRRMEMPLGKEGRKERSLRAQIKMCTIEGDF